MPINARHLLLHAAFAALGIMAAPATAVADTSPKVLRFALRAAESGFDPAQISDLYSRNIAGNIFDAPYRWEYLARPVRMRPNTAVALPEASADFKTFTLRIRPGIYFADDPAFKGVRRELTAADYVYSIKRLFDPRWKSPSFTTYENNKLIGMAALREAALRGRPFDYDREVEGLRAIDRYTIRFRLEQANPRFADDLTDGAVVGAMAREVVEAYGDRIVEHPVGTGPYKLGTWKRSSLIVLDRNPGYRDEFYREDPPADDPLAQATAARLAGRKLPMIDRIEISVVEESQPRWLSFLNGEMDLIEQVPDPFIELAMPNDHVAPHLARKGIHAVRYTRSDVVLSYFAMENPVVGGYTPAKVALRRAISLALDTGQEIRVARRGQAIIGQSPMGPGVYGYDPSFRSEMGEFDPARSKALLDLYGYVDRNGDGWREQPDGSPLVIQYATEPEESRRQLSQLFKKNLDAIGVRVEFRIAKWPENLKASRAGRLMMWGVGWSGGPDGDQFLTLGYGPGKGQYNHARFDQPDYNRVYELQKRLPDGPERLAAMDDAKKLLVAYMPYKAHVHRIFTDLAQPWVVGFHRNVFMREWWSLVDIDNAERARRAP